MREREKESKRKRERKKKREYKHMRYNYLRKRYQLQMRSKSIQTMRNQISVSIGKSAIVVLHLMRLLWKKHPCMVHFLELTRNAYLLVDSLKLEVLLEHFVRRVGPQQIPAKQKRVYCTMYFEIF